MIYCVEDDKSIRELVVYSLNNTGFKAIGFEDAEKMQESLKTEKPELILLDLMLPGEDGITVLKKLKRNVETSNIPIIVITAKDTEYDKVIGLDNGADDYIVKPFGIMELISRIKAVLRRTQNTEKEEIYKCGDITLNKKAHTVKAGDEFVELTNKEFKLLYLLLKNMGNVLTRDHLLQTIWGYDFDGETRTVDVHIRTLRSKLLDCGELIKTVRGVGYRIGK
ncbi:MAG: response regulator transcription factor [Clostridia bacterium]|nr:response regulator transcription factor [Clostridia bacterium]